MITFREYAVKWGISYEAVRKQVTRYEKELKEHIVIQGTTKYLDDDAVLFLDSKRACNVVRVTDGDPDQEHELVEMRKKCSELFENLEELKEELEVLKAENHDHLKSIIQLQKENAEKEADIRKEYSQKEADYMQMIREKDTALLELMQRKDDEIRELNEKLIEMSMQKVPVIAPDEGQSAPDPSKEIARETIQGVNIDTQKEQEPDNEADTMQIESPISARDGSQNGQDSADQVENRQQSIINRLMFWKH